jgi:hypothetical protein
MHTRMYPTYRGAHANRGWMTESSEQSLRAEQRGKRLRLTRRRRLRAGREATLGSDEHRATGAASGTAASVHRAAGGHGQRGTGRSHGGTPTASAEHFGSEAPSKRGHGQPGQRERRQDAGPGNRSRVQLRERRSVRRQDRLGAAPSPGNRWWRHRQRAGQPATGPQRASPAMPSGTTGDV